MAIYHANVKSFSRGKGQSSVAAAAYRAGICLKDSRTELKHNYSRKRGVVSYHMLAPKKVPSWCLDPKQFWDINEQAEDRMNARTAREVEVSLPQSLNRSQREDLALDLGQLLVDRYQVVVMAAIHAPPKKGDQRNHHVHLLLSARKVDEYGLGDRACSELDARQGKGAEELKKLRRAISEVINRHLEDAGLTTRVDHRSLAAQAKAAALNNDFDRAKELTRRPTRHLGKSKVAVLRKTKITTTFHGTSQDVAQKLRQLVSDHSQKHVHEVPSGHSHEAALKDLQREKAALNKVKSKLEKVAGSTPNKPAGNSYNYYAPSTRHLSRVTRLARSQGRADSEVLNEQAEVIEKWLEAQLEIADQSLELLRSVPGIQIEKCFQDAYGALLSKRVESNADKLFLFEDTEVLARKMKRYACMIVRPYRARVAYLYAKAQLAEHADAPNSAEAARARQHFQRRKTLVSKRVLQIQERRLGMARQAMIEVHQALEANFTVKVMAPLASMDEPSSMRAGTEGGWQLKPRSLRL